MTFMNVSAMIGSERQRLGQAINATVGAIVLLLALRLLGASGWGGHSR